MWRELFTRATSHFITPRSLARFETRKQFFVAKQLQFVAGELERVRGFENFQECALLTHIGFGTGHASGRDLGESQSCAVELVDAPHRIAPAGALQSLSFGTQPQMWLPSPRGSHSRLPIEFDQLPVGVLQLRGAFLILPPSGLNASSTGRGGRLRGRPCRRDVNGQNRKRERQFSFSDGHAPAENQFVVPPLGGSVGRGSTP